VLFISAIEGLGKDPRNGGLSDTTQTGKKEGVPQAA